MNYSDDSYGFFKAIREGDSERVEQYLLANPSLINEKYTSYFNALILAIACNREEVVEVLITHGTDPNQGLLAAIFKNNPEIASILLKVGADPNIIYSSDVFDELFPFDDSAHIFDMLIAKGLDIGARDGDGRTLLHRTILGHNTEVPVMLVNAGADVNTRDNYGQTPLFDGAKGGTVKVVEALLNAGANPYTRDSDGNTVISAAINPMNDYFIFEIDDEGNELWRMDMHQTRREILEMLVQRMGREVLTIFDAASLGDLQRIIEIILRTPSVLDSRDQYKFRPLQHAVRNGHVHIVEFLLKKGASTGTKEEDDDAPIFLASRYGHLEIAKLLIEYGADVRARDKLNTTPLHEAAVDNNPEMVRLLLENGADPRAVDDDCNTPLHHCAESLDCSKLLIEAGADIHARGLCDETPLHHASAEAVRFLIESGADVHALNYRGETPLFQAIKSGDLELQQAIIQASGPNAVSVFELAAMGKFGKIKRANWE